MVEYSEQGRCVGATWYHLNCAGLRSAPRGKWLCPKCSEAEASMDSKMEYTKLLLWMGLCDRVRHSAVYANDSEAMLYHCCFDAVEFFVRGHLKYLTFALRLLSNINGAVSPQLAHTLTWNRAVNLVGGPDRNLEMDLFMEFLNRAYKESSKVSRGQLTPATIERHCKMLAMGFQMDELFDMSRSVSRKHGKPDRSGEVLAVAVGVIQYQLVTCIQGRTHHWL